LTGGGDVMHTTDSSSSSNQLLPIPSPTRKRRWDLLNPILDEAARKSKKKDKSSASFSNITWREVENAFTMEKLVLNPRKIPDDKLDALHEQLLGIHRLYGEVISGKEAKRLQFISPILNAVCLLLPGVTISVEEDMKGIRIHANGRFEYILNYYNKKVCIVEAKKDDMEQGKVQSLLGCEVVAEAEKCPCVYAIVTNYIQWLFYKNTEDSVFGDDVTLNVIHGDPDKNSVGQVASLIYGILIEIEQSSQPLVAASASANHSP